jgi:antibiotic biosynthesis monooxygenase (ABM) superfamily enzyme
MDTGSVKAPVPAAAREAHPPGAPGGRPGAPPSVHVRVVVTWLAIFPLVALGMTAIAPFSADWHPVLRSLVLTLVVVPLAVYVVVPRLLAGYVALRRRSTMSNR